MMLLLTASSVVTVTISATMDDYQFLHQMI